jgi:hypothetical protein
MINCADEIVCFFAAVDGCVWSTDRDYRLTVMLKAGRGRRRWVETIGGVEKTHQREVCGEDTMEAKNVFFCTVLSFFYLAFYGQYRTVAIIVALARTPTAESDYDTVRRLLYSTWSCDSKMQDRYTPLQYWTRDAYSYTQYVQYSIPWLQVILL